MQLPGYGKYILKRSRNAPIKKEFAGSEVSGSAIFYFTRFYCAFYFSRWDSINSFFFTRNGVQLLP